MENNILAEWQNYILANFHKYKFAEDLGYLYEDFIAQNPLLRAEMGVYYTPVEVVRYIVQETIGKKISGKTPNEILDITCLDPSCGSGSFLLGAYDYLLKWYLEYYISLVKIGKKVPELTPNMELTTQTKKDILIRHIFGVDIDEQAVEVTKLSLLIKCLEGETKGSIETQNTILKQKVLPSLEENILCGNSLIGTDYDGVFSSKKEERKINLFDWKIGFEQIFRKQKGFHFVIGNPPYGADLQQENYIKTKFPFSSDMREINSYLCFVEMGLRLMRENAIMGFIVPDTFLLKNQYANFRKFLLDFTNITEIVETGAVFDQAKATPNVILMLEKNPNGKNGNNQHIVQRKQLDYKKNVLDTLLDLDEKKWFVQGELSYKDWKKYPEWQLGHFVETSKIKIIEKILQNPKNIPLNTLPNIEVDRGLEGGKNSLLEKTRKKNVYKILIPDNIFKYFIATEKVLFTENYKPSFDKDRILIIRIRSQKIKERIIATLETEKRATLKTLQQIYFKNNGNSKIDLKFLLGILNSDLINFYCTHFLVDDLNKEYLSKIPIPNIDLSDEKDKIKYELLIKKVTEMFELTKLLSETRQSLDQDRIQRRIKAKNNDINELVFELYDLTPDEIAIINGE